VTQPPGRVTVRGRAITKRFGSVVALAGLDVDLHGGHSVAILGPNGAGKSTFLKVLAGLVRPTSGSLEVSSRTDGKSRRASRAAARALVGFAGHATMLYPELTARENLIFHGRLQGLSDPHARADALLDAEGLASVASRRAGTFSRGIAQRLSIARALVQDPPLVLLDEPFAGLDRRAGDRLSQRLSRMRSEGRALVLVTHDVARAAANADTALVLIAGRIVHRAQGSELEPDRLERAYADALEAELPRASDRADGLDTTA
jgi:heme exporter protein A